MKNDRKKSNSNPTLTELLEPYLRNPPSPLHPSRPQSPPPKPRMPQPWRLASSHTVLKSPAKPWRRFCTPSPQYYRVHPREFRELVQRLTGARAPSHHDRPSEMGERRVQCNQNAAGIVLESTLPPVGTIYLDQCARPVLNPSAILDNDKLSEIGERVQYDQNAAGVEKKSTLHDMSTNYWDWCAPPIVSPRTMGSMGENCWEEDGGM